MEVVDEVVGRADEALHHAKRNGRNRVHLSDAIRTTRDPDPRVKFVPALLQAIGNNADSAISCCACLR